MGAKKMNNFILTAKTAYGRVGLRKWAANEINDLLIEVINEDPMTLKVMPQGLLAEHMKKDDFKGVVGKVTKSLYLKFLRTSITKNQRLSKKDYEVEIN